LVSGERANQAAPNNVIPDRTVDGAASLGVLIGLFTGFFQGLAQPRQARFALLGGIIGAVFGGVIGAILVRPPSLPIVALGCGLFLVIGLGVRRLSRPSTPSSEFP
jgi:hypothetical protein